MAGEPDGTLLSWRDIASTERWDTLLLGNGLSINVWEPFGYGQLYDRVKQTKLSRQDRRLFASTPNFERVLADLLTAIRVAEALELETRVLRDHYRNVQQSVVSAVRQVHLNLTRVPVETRQAISAEMARFEWVFTTNYDLLVYWAMAVDGFDPFMDHFRHGNRCEFDPDRARVPKGSVPVYFLHGALHLVVGGSGVTWKLRQHGLGSILDQLGKPIEGDVEARPLLVTEGSAVDKLAAIDDNPYLSHALDRLRERDLPVIVFGSSLSEQDSHLADALSEHPHRPIATHPLGSPAMRVPA